MRQIFCLVSTQVHKGAIKVKHYHNHLNNLIAISQWDDWDVFLFNLLSKKNFINKNFTLNGDFAIF